MRPRVLGSIKAARKGEERERGCEMNLSPEGNQNFATPKHAFWDIDFKLKLVMK